mmetsp:Transcript_20133/g.43288  ORF Transcript_20133/g.43288 Transcript_20133/m.43288 type:complete len:219 (-) Transcript_20133:74-730(-)
MELPCIAFKQLPASAELPRFLAERVHGWVVITSPEAAEVFLDAWRHARKPQMRIACVGAASAKVLKAAGLPTPFIPSKATAKTLAAELPLDEAAMSVLYPCSALAATTLQDALEGRGFSVTRLETYTTVEAPWVEDATAAARAASVVSFASPSAVRVWQERAGTSAVAVCIGETSAQEARRLGFAHVLFPESPGIEAWSETIASLDMSQWADTALAKS